MRLGTKILILTLAITLALAGIIVWVVTRDLTAHETWRGQADISRAVSDYFQQIQTLHALDHTVVKILMEDPQNRSQLELLDGGEEATREHFRLLFKEVLPTSLSSTRQPQGGSATTRATSKRTVLPVFYVILNFEGRPLLTFAPDDPRLSDPLASEQIRWPHEPLLEDEPVLTQRYVWIDRRLYLALGMPLKIDISAPPSHALFIGYRIDDEWAAWLLGDAAAVDDIPPQAWFVVDGNVVARATASSHADSAVAAAATSGPVGVRRPVKFRVIDEHLIGETFSFDLPENRYGALIVASSLTRALARLRHLQATIAWVTAGVIIVAVIAFRFVSNFIARPVRQLVAGTRRVAQGEFDQPIVFNRRDELGELAASFNDMAAGLQQRDLVKSTFGKFVDPSIVEGFLADPSRLMPGGEKRVQTVLFSDVMGFTTMSEKLDPDDLIGLLNGYLGAAADIVADTRGIVDKFIGDAVVAFWGPPITDEAEHAGLACVAALRMVRSTRRLDEECARLGVPPLGVRVGAATGELLVGIIGSANKYNYTVMGDTANLGSRLEGLNKLYGTQILVTERTAREAQPAVLTRRIDRVRVVGRSEPVELHEVLAERGEENGVLSLRCEAYAEAFACYQQRNWSCAAEKFKKIAAEWQDDAAARAMAQRCRAFEQTDPGGDWDGVWNALSK